MRGDALTPELQFPVASEVRLGIRRECVTPGFNRRAFSTKDGAPAAAKLRDCSAVKVREVRGKREGGRPFSGQLFI
jgi:hypothetical protein